MTQYYKIYVKEFEDVDIEKAFKKYEIFLNNMYLEGYYLFDHLIYEDIYNTNKTRKMAFYGNTDAEHYKNTGEPISIVKLKIRCLFYKK